MIVQRKKRHPLPVGANNSFLGEELFKLGLDGRVEIRQAKREDGERVLSREDSSHKLTGRKENGISETQPAS